MGTKKQANTLHYNCTEALSQSSQYLLTKMVALPKLQNFCGCTSLKTGTLIIGSLNLVTSFIGILASFSILGGSTVLNDLMAELEKQFGSEWSRTRPQTDPQLMFQQAISIISIIIGVVLLIASIFSIVISACLIHGARTRNVSLMWPWIFLSVMSLANPIAMVSILGWLLNAYFILVVWNFKIEIEAVGDHQDKVHCKSEERC